MEKPGGRRLVHLGRTVIPLSRRSKTLPVALNREVKVVRDKKVETTVAIIVDPCRACAPARIIHTGLVGHIGEGSVSVIVIQHVATEICDIKILKTIVVIVSNCDSHSVSDMSDARLLGHVNE